MSWREEWETKSYLEPFTPDNANRLRVRMRIEQGTVTRFTAQFETEIEGETYQVVRYDTAHGSAHRDILDWRGQVIAKKWIAGPDRYNEALTDAVGDLKSNWRIYRADFLRRKR